MINKKKTFIKHPEIIGGKDAFKKYIKENLQYPQNALENRVEGIVHLEAQIDDNGNVLSTQLIHGIGYGCDEEAIRLIENLKFGAVKNRGVRIKSTKNFKIEFKIPMQKKPSVSYSFKSSSNKKENKVNPLVQNRNYNYTINIE